MIRILSAAIGSFSIVAAAILTFGLLHFRIDERADVEAAVYSDFAVGLLITNGGLLIASLFGKWSLRQLLLLELAAVLAGACVSLGLLLHHREQIRIRSELPSGFP